VTCPACGSAAIVGARFCRSCGAALGTAASPSDVGKLPGATKLPPRATGGRPSWAALSAGLTWRSVLPATRRGRVLTGAGAAAAVVLLLLGYFAAVAIGDARYPPDRPVKELFAALADRDTEQAARLAGCTTSPACRGGALSSGYEPPTAVHIGAVQYGDPTDDTRRPNKSLAYVPVTYRLSNGEQTSTVRVQRASSGIMRPWAILSGATGLLDIAADRVDRVKLGGATVPVGDKGVHTMDTLVGTYTAAVADDDPLFVPTTGAARVDVIGSLSTASVTKLQLDLMVRPEVIAQVDAQVRARVTEFAAQEELNPSRYRWGISRTVIGARDVKWTVLRHPVIDVVPTDDPGPGDAPATVRTTTAGRLSVTYSAFVSAGGDRDTITEELPIEVDGTVTIDLKDPTKVIWEG
jgi:hypothetical protein